MQVFGIMTKSYRTYLPEQDLLLPPSLRDWLPENHLAHFVSDVVDQLDLRDIESVYEEDERGQPPYHPQMMTKILIYGYCVGVFSSRKIQKKLLEDVGFRMLAAGNEPDFRTISDFRKLHLKALQGLFDQLLQIALQTGTMKLGMVALDGSKVKANASKHKAMSYGRMQEDEKRLKEEVKKLLQQAEKVDAEEDARYGRDRTGDELPAELARRATRLKKIQEAKRALEERAREQARSEGKSVEEAVITSCRVRLRPILMTSLATIIGMVPMALKLGTGSEQYAPLARAIIGGLLVSVLLTVFVVLYITVATREEQFGA